MVRQPLWEAVGKIQAARVMAVPRSREGDAGTWTRLLMPSKLRADPKRPWGTQIAPAMVAVLPRPEASAAVVPAPSLKPKAATKPGGVLAVVAVAGLEYALRLPAASEARTR